MTRVNILLLLVLMGSCMYLVRTSYEARRLFNDLDKSQSEERALEIEFQRLSAEKQAQATPLRVEKTARDKLRMRNATPAITQYETWPPVAASGVQQ